ncbi:MAG: hypothetical protein IT458_06550 [Planctomycetes bacterium]|nr:hypothetical protein [Planctomycetota bacterium]
MRLLAPALALALAGCVVPHRPARLELPATADAQLFARIQLAVQSLYPRLEEIDAEGFRIRSAWHPWQPGERPAQRRASVFLLDPHTLAVVVEARYLQDPFLGEVGWSSVQISAESEGHLLRQIEALVRGPNGAGH